MKYKSLGVVVGRFQCDRLTEGHLRLIETVKLRHDAVLVVVGVPRTPPNATNPLNYKIRHAMIRSHFPLSSGVIVSSLSDERDNRDWSISLDELIDKQGFDSATLYSGRDGFLPWYSGRYRTEELNIGIVCSATNLRHDIENNPNIHSTEFRQGVIYAHQTRQHQTYETVDIAFLKYQEGERLRICLGKKPKEGKLRFPGGFVEPGEQLVDAAVRELKEETGLVAGHGLHLIGDYLIDEWRIRRQKGVGHRTFLFAGFYFSGGMMAGDDLASCDWYDFEEIFENANEIMMDEHKMMMIHGLRDWLVKNKILDSYRIVNNYFPSTDKILNK